MIEDFTDAYRQNLALIRDVALDYDGYRTVDELKDLIDELRGMAIDGLRGNRPQYLRQGRVYEFVDGINKEVPEERWSESVKEWKKLPGW